MKKYVLFDKKDREKLEIFYKSVAENNFVEIESIFQTLISLYSDASLFFNCNKFKEVFSRDPKFEEITQTLSHIQCWKAISENQLIDDNDMVLIAEADIVLVPNAIELANEYAKKYSSYNIIKLQRDFPTHNQESLFKEGDTIDALVYGDKENYNNSGASLYLIRKSIARKLFEYTIKEKPYWKADYFADFISLVDNVRHIAQAEKLLGHIPKYKKMPKNPLFSIIIPIYNTSNYLDDCLRSVVEQKFDDYEIILVNDGSTDNSFDICANYMKQYGNIVLISKPNSGLSDARNTGIHLARGKYLIFLDGDDYWNGRYILFDLFKIYQHSDPDLIINFFSSVYPDRIVPHEPCKEKCGDFSRDFESLFTQYIYLGFTWTKVIKREIIVNNNLYFIKGRKFEDIPWSFNLVRHINNYAVYPSAFYMYRREREGSISRYVSITNQKSLFDNFIDVSKELNYIKEYIPSLYPIMLNYTYDIHKYVINCYNILSEENKEKLHNMKIAHDSLIAKL